MSFTIYWYECESILCNESGEPGIEFILMYDNPDNDKEKKFNAQQNDEISKMICSQCKNQGFFTEKASYLLSQTISIEPAELRDVLKKYTKKRGRKALIEHLGLLGSFQPIFLDDVELLYKLNQYCVDKGVKRRDISQQLYIWLIRAWGYYIDKTIISWAKIQNGTWESETGKKIYGFGEPERVIKEKFLEGMAAIQLWCQGEQKKLLSHEISDNFIKEMKIRKMNIILNHKIEDAIRIAERYREENFYQKKLGSGECHQYCSQINKKNSYYGKGRKERPLEVLIRKSLFDLTSKEVKSYDHTLESSENQKDIKKYTFCYSKQMLHLYSSKMRLTKASKIIASSIFITIQQIIDYVKNKPTKPGGDMDRTEEFLKGYLTGINEKDGKHPDPPNPNKTILSKIADGTQLADLKESERKKIISDANQSFKCANALRAAQYAGQEKIKQESWAKIIDEVLQEKKEPITAQLKNKIYDVVKFVVSLRPDNEVMNLDYAFQDRDTVKTFTINEPIVLEIDLPRDDGQIILICRDPNKKEELIIPRSSGKEDIKTSISGPEGIHTIRAIWTPERVFKYTHEHLLKMDEAQIKQIIEKYTHAIEKLGPENSCELNLSYEVVNKEK